MEGQHRGRAQSDGDLANPSRTQKKRPESAEEPIAHSEVRRTLARTAQHDQLLLEQEILSDDGSHAAGSAELRGCDGQVKQGEQEILHARDSVGQNSGATQWCPRPRFSDRIRNSRPTGEGRGAADQDRVVVSTARPIRCPRSDDQEGEGARTATVEEGVWLPSASARRECVLPVQVDRRRLSSGTQFIGATA